MPKSIAIDGPAGSGKSTVAKLVADQLGFQYINSGMFYRAVGLYFLQNKIDYTKNNNITPTILKAIKLDWKIDSLLLNDKDVTKLIQAPEYSSMASQIAIYENVREFVNHYIKIIAKDHHIVVDGRDIGSHVLVDATLKIFLAASIEVRAQRIYKRNQDLNISNKSLEEIKIDVVIRDQRDYTRKVAPLVKAEDAILIDCSALDIAATTKLIIKHYQEKI